MEFIRTPILFLIFLLYISLCGLTSGPFTAQAQGPPLPPSTYVPNLQLHAVDTHWGNITYGTIHTRLMSFEVSGQDLSDTVHVLAPEFFEMRIDSLTGLFRNRISIPAVGQLSPTRFYVRLKDSLPAATYTGELMALSNGQLGIAAGIEPAVVSPRTLQLVGLQALNKDYDGNQQAQVGGQAVFDGLAFGQQFTPDLSGLNWNFVSANAGTDISVVPVGLLPAPNANYIVSTPNIRASILPKRISIGGLSAQNKMYDGGTSVSILGIPQYVGLVAGETFGPPSMGTWAFEDKRAGLQKAVRSSGHFMAPSNNYVVDTLVLRADIAPAVLTVQSAVVRRKIYDRSAVAVVDSVTIHGILPFDTVIVSSSGIFQQFRAGNQIPVTLNIQLSGTDGPNYTVAPFSGLFADISPRPVFIGGLSVAEKEFDGTRTATLLGVPQLQGILAGDETDIILGGQPTALFATSDTGRNISVSVSGFQLSGVAAGSYDLRQPTGLQGNIVLSVLAAWTFQPTRGTLQQPEANVGQGSMSLLGSMNSTSWSGGMNSQNGCGNAGTTSAGDTAWSISNTNPGSVNESSGIQIMLSSSQFRNIKMEWEQRWSGSSPNTIRLQYSTDGNQWVNIHMTDSNTTYCLGRLDLGRFETDSAADKFRRIRVDLSQIPQVNERAILGFRIVAAHFRGTGAFRQVINPSTAAVSGAWRFDNIRITGNRANPTVWNGVIWSQGPPDTSIHAIVSAPLRITHNLSTHRLEIDSGVLFSLDSGAVLNVRGSLINRGTMHVVHGRAILRNTYSGNGLIRGSTRATLEWHGLIDVGSVLMDSLSGSNGRTLENLIMNMGPQGRLRLGNKMVVMGYVDLNGGVLQTQDNLCLSSTSDRFTAQIRGGTNGSIQGKVETERHLSWMGVGHSGYRFVGSPHRSAIPFAQVGGLPSTPNGVIRFSEPLNAYLSVPSSSNQWNPAQAYGIWTDSIRTIRMMGEPQLNPAGPYFLQNQSARWNLLGNPFPSAVAWDSVQKSNADQAVWVWKKDSIIPGAGNWASYINGVGINGANGILAPLQGFMVRAGAVGLSSIFYPINARQPDLLTAFFRQNQQDPRLSIELEQASPHFREESLIQLKTDATIGFDIHHDAGYLGDETYLSPSLASLDGNGSAYSIQSIPDPAGMPRAIPLRTEFGQLGTYQLHLQASNWPSTSPIFLEDRVLQRIETIFGHLSYLFFANGPADSLRFRIHLNSVGVGVEAHDLTAIQVYYHSGMLHLRGAEALRRMEIRDMRGRLVQIGYHEGQHEIHMPLDLANGAYSVRLFGKQGSVTRKLLI
jgi:hypothetical protein